MIVVSDTSPITNLAAVGQLDLLPRLFGEVVVPEAVARELRAAPAGSIGAVEVAEIEWFRVCAVADRTVVESLAVELDEGEAETIALGKQVGGDFVLIDERRGRRAAERLGMKPLGLLGVLVLAKRRGVLREVGPVLSDLVSTAGFWFSQELRERVLREAGE